MRLIDTKYGVLKHLLCAGLLILACELTVRAEPISLTVVLVSVAISASLAAAQIGLQMLMQPKPKPVDKNKLQGDIQLMSVGEDLPINEPYGSSLGDGRGGIKMSGTIVHMNPIRRTVVTTPGQSSGSGKGAPKAPPTREYHYFTDIVLMVGRGPLRIKQIKANTDLLYQDFTPNQYLNGTTYEAEDRTDDSGGLTTVPDVGLSGGAGLELEENEWLEWDDIAADSVLRREVHIAYLSEADIEAELELNGTAYDIVLPDSFGELATVNFPQEFLPSVPNTIRITNKTAADVTIDRLVVGIGPIIGPGDNDEGCILSGLKYPGYVNPEPSYDPMALRAVYAPDPRGCNEWNYQANRNANGEISANLTGNANIRIYPGNKTQLPDPLLQEYFEARYGAGSTPAFRGRCIIVLENFEITKYASVPNFTVVAEHETINSLGELYSSLAERAGLEEEEYDFSALNAVPLRGMVVTERRAPTKTMELLNRVFDVDVCETFDGVVTGVVPSETVVVTIPADELDSQENKDASADSGESFNPVRTVYRDDTDLPQLLDVSFFDPSRDWEVKNVHSLREITDAGRRKANIETGLVLTEEEAQKFADRDFHRQYVEKNGIQITTFHKYSYLKPTDLIAVTDKDGTVSRMRIKVMEGWIPSALKINGVSRDAVEFPPRLFVTPNESPVLPSLTVPAPIVGTFIDLAVFREEQTAGFYVAAALTDTHYQWQTAGLFRELEGDDWEALTGIPNQATMGLTVSGTDGTLGDVPGGWEPGDWDETNTLIIDLYHGELETLTDDQVLNDGRNFLVIGNELIQFGTATRDNDFPNRWEIGHLQRGLRGTLAAASTHSDSERAVLYTEAWRWIEQDPALANATRTYKFVSAGGDLETASSVDWNWTGRTQYNTPIYSTVDNGVPVLDTDPPIVGLEGSFWLITIKRPVSNGYSIDAAEIRVRKSADDTVLRLQDIGLAVQGRVLAPVDDAKVDYRWHNKYSLSGSDGWSAWSAVETILASTPPGPTPTITPGGNLPGPGDIEPINPCFLDGTLVLMADWTEKRIEDIKPGRDHVMAWRPGGQILPGRVKAFSGGTSTEYQTLAFRDGDSLQVTGLHNFCADWGRKVKASDLEAGSMVRRYKKGWGFAEISANERTELSEAVRVNNWEIEAMHTYFVKGPNGTEWKAVHNLKSEY